jgi:hypothetical protein
VRNIKPRAGYNEAIGTALGIEVDEQTLPDLAALRPELKLTLSGGAVKVGWGWGGLIPITANEATNHTNLLTQYA